VEKRIEGAMNELDFSGKQVLVVGGSSGIGNGIAQAFRGKGARVHVCGTRASAADYSPDEGSNLEGLDYEQLDVSDPKAIENFKPSFDRLDVAFSSREPVSTSLENAPAAGTGVRLIG
jgi:3-oxoacyl-[acyl-carrier protein] reductase